jgi:hypothetical protein
MFGVFDCCPGVVRGLIAGLLWTNCWAAFADSAGFGDGVQVGQITESNLAELSGIVASRNNPGVLWVHNDQARGDVFAVSTNGLLLATWSLQQDISDFEDIAIGPGPLPEVQYLYCGDIGDNLATRPNIHVYRAPETAAYPYQSAHPRTQNFPLVEKFTFVYPDGSHNAEALMVDPQTGDVFIATKERFRSRIYRAASADLRSGATLTLTLVADIQFDVVSAGDISPDGTEILLRQENYANRWARLNGQSVAQAFTSEPAYAPVIGEPTEPNGEAVSYAADGMGYYTVSEGLDPLLYYFPSLSSTAVNSPRQLVPAAGAWRYKDDGSNQGTAWRAADFDDSAWRAGAAQFGYGEDDEQTKISYGSDKDHKYITTYFRTTFVIDDPGTVQSLVSKVLFDDGVAVYLNGTEVLRRNLAAGAAYADAALSAGGDYENVWQTFSVPNLLRAGSNTLAVEVHRHSRTEGDLSFDLQLLATLKASPPEFADPPRSAGGSTWTLDFTATGSGLVTLEVSTDLHQWTVAGTATPVDGKGSFTVPSSGAHSFYRMRQ